jgi:hypothetical protein
MRTLTRTSGPLPHPTRQQRRKAHTRTTTTIASGSVSPNGHQPPTHPTSDPAPPERSQPAAGRQIIFTTARWTREEPVRLRPGRPALQCPAARQHGFFERFLSDVGHAGLPEPGVHLAGRRGGHARREAEASPDRARLTMGDDGPGECRRVGRRRSESSPACWGCICDAGSSFPHLRNWTDRYYP